MSNERIDLTQDELRDTLYDWMTKGYEPQMAIPDDLPNEISEILFAIEHLGLIAELKRCYEELDEYDKLVGLLIENHFVETSPYETVKHLIETHQDYRASE